jgi:cystathionine gamma-synthase
MNNTLPSLATLFAQADGLVDPQTGGLVPPIQPSSTYARDEKYRPLSESYVYGRDSNSVVRLGEQILTKSEHGEDGLLFPSGMAAIAALMRTIANGGKILAQSGIYWGTTEWLRAFCQRRNIELREVDASDTALFSETITTFKPDLTFVETPSNPWLKITDIASIAQACGKTGTILVVDSTAATPVLSNPLEHGADVVMHSATKAINGHSDVLAGFLAVKDASLPIWQMIKTDRHGAGALLGPFEAWLLIRGMRTLPLRMERMSESALKIANFLQEHERVAEVLYPGLAPQKILAEKQMQGGFGCLLSFLIKGHGDTALSICGRLKLFHRATSLGGVESLVEHRHSIEQAIPPSLIRLSVGIENCDELIADLGQALKA